MPSKTDLNKPTICSIIVPRDQLNDLSPILIITCKFDIIRERVEKTLTNLESEIVVTVLTNHWTIHDFVMLNVVAETPAAREEIAQASRQLRKT
ncbi:MAG: hypothetical protein AB7V56_15945 [Candidatus Nitrosocosmicus sp.]|jgi:acetyl esterase|uniref:hypothetical protein n=1 Tax=Candidatus Nitrosocosmicus agrestis TaxID=2563600 RepID=UPI00122E9AA6|nr:hypothetical protein [Candidatus Nitrosocosmicus sp. SS]MDR4489591.1 hypothetical protein [Candidatus Nitrosocosmicus sp.]HET8792699.1 hypothetical protein [Nitrososphaeraceae archaeon]KAA2282859.1 hypothetical protein F1Z66_04110 [Candidatus Nitrosocosmicus sp. SS]KAF0869061.1 hypothetical protein E5N71_06390 [Candidatus Nitrosocosmicus sp. SS]HET6589939.1 hypothetical protein [Candidatus Nitrosocosmicus sp.]